MSTSRARDLSKTNLLQAVQDDVVYMHIGGSASIRTLDYRVVSCLETAEENMRHSAQYERSKTFGSVLCAFAILDQLGTCYADSQRPTNTLENGVQRALHQFCDIDENSSESRHLYMFRNGVVHDASMTSETPPRKKKPVEYYIFRYDDSITGPVQPSNRAWNGTSADVSDDTISTINREKLVDIVSMAVNSVRTMFFDRRADLQVLLSEDQIIKRFLLWRKL